MENLKHKKIAVIGSGIAGLGFSYIAHHNGLDVTLYEKNNYFGGHSNTIDLEIENKKIAVDTGFLVHNRLTYPNLIQLFEKLGVEIVDSEMTLSIKVEGENFEWGGSDLGTVFGQKANIFNPAFYYFLYEILKFNRNAKSYLKWATSDRNRTLGDLLEHFSYSQYIKDWYLIPMAAAIWSTPANKILNFPAHTFIQFCLNHHLLQVNDRPIWRTVKNGSRNYVQKITQLISDKRLNSPVLGIKLQNEKIVVVTKDQEEVFDSIVFASHADETVKFLNENFKAQNILRNFKYEKNVAYVHSDISFLPKRKKLWSAWNYVNAKKDSAVTVNYLINKLQPLETSTPIIVTLNPHREIDKSKLYRVIEYAHPLFDNGAIKAQQQLDEIQGVDNLFFAGAWTGYGFHEDGLKSAIVVAKKMGLKIPWHEDV